MADGPGLVEVVDTGADDGPVPGRGCGGELVRQGRLAGGVRAVDRDAQYPVRVGAGQQVGECVHDVVARRYRGMIGGHGFGFRRVSFAGVAERWPRWVGEGLVDGAPGDAGEGGVAVLVVGQGDESEGQRPAAASCPGRVIGSDRVSERFAVFGGQQGPGGHRVAGRISHAQAAEVDDGL
ncbi:hypothetical protein [Parafrankia discariae]|uniref:hypothetical protein n=1 Tax=Parafrankia discariae TaxID=365528 RepID=UPI001E524976|nr:hypothetical protein [Parafrankia discariae]